MTRTRSGAGNVNENRNQPHVVERVAVVAATPEPITMAGVRTMIQAMMAEQKEEMRQLLLNNRSEPSIPVEQPELNEGQSEEGNNSGTIGQANPPIVRRNNHDGGNDGRGCKYKDFMASKPPCHSRSPAPVQFMDWISEMETLF